MSKFTPGPWRVSADGIDVGPEDAFAPFDGCGCCGSPWMSARDGLADARLIAAAPELYVELRTLAEILYDVVEQVPDITWRSHAYACIRAARAALAKVDE